MRKGREAFVGIDTAKARNAVAVAESGRQGEVRYLGEFANTPDAVTKMVRKLGDRYETLHFCYEAGPTGYGLYRQILALGHGCTVVAPSLIPRRPGERVKTNRRGALSLARLLRAAELTAVWVPDETHEAVRDLVRTRAMAIEDYRRKRQHISSFLLRPRLRWRHELEGTAPALAGRAELRPCCATVRVPGDAERDASGG
jgi:transposase